MREAFAGAEDDGAVVAAIFAVGVCAVGEEEVEEVFAGIEDVGV